jgi:hypothetical protein
MANDIVAATMSSGARRCGNDVVATAEMSAQVRMMLSWDRQLALTGQP